MVTTEGLSYRRGYSFNEYPSIKTVLFEKPTVIVPFKPLNHGSLVGIEEMSYIDFLFSCKQLCLLQQEVGNLVITPMEFGLQLGDSRCEDIALILFDRITGDDLAVRQTLNPAAEFPPLVQLVVAPMLVDVGQNLIIQHNRPLLVVAGGKKLNHLPPDKLLGLSEGPVCEPK